YLARGRARKGPFSYRHLGATRLLPAGPLLHRSRVAGAIRLQLSDGHGTHPPASALWTYGSRAPQETLAHVLFSPPACAALRWAPRGRLRGAGARRAGPPLTLRPFGFLRPPPAMDGPASAGR